MNCPNGCRAYTRKIDRSRTDHEQIMTTVRNVVDTWSPMSQCSRRTLHPAHHILITMFLHLINRACYVKRSVYQLEKRCFNLPRGRMLQLTQHTGQVETLGLTPKRLYLLKTDHCNNNIVWMVCVAKYMLVDMRDTFCCRFSLFREFSKIKITVSTSPKHCHSILDPNIAIPKQLSDIHLYQRNSAEIKHPSSD